MRFDPRAVSDEEGERSLSLEREQALLLVIDVQEKLARAMQPDARARVERNIVVLMKAARRLGLPIVGTEQYPKGLGHTVAVLRELMPDAPMQKVEFSCGANKDIARHILGTARRQILVVGMEAHVCVFQTVRDLARGGFAVFVPEDAVLSRSETNRAVGLRLCEKAGAILTSTETALFDLLGSAGTPEFKELAPLIK
ncbi:MAG TPA: isochorismatase family protein [Myxococcales bacterium]|nr:isochorismatase family protein [Myxococcales bacterium]